MLRTSFLCAAVLCALATPCFAQQISLVNLAPGERQAMLSTCGRLSGDDRAMCRNVVDDSKVIANYKRSCLEAMTLLMHGTAWSKVKSLPPTLTCREGLARAGYPVQQILQKLAGAL